MSIFHSNVFSSLQTSLSPTSKLKHNIRVLGSRAMIWNCNPGVRGKWVYLTLSPKKRKNDSSERVCSKVNNQSLLNMLPLLTCEDEIPTWNQWSVYLLIKQIFKKRIGIISE
jgi:hypothetical protein